MPAKQRLISIRRPRAPTDVVNLNSSTAGVPELFEGVRRFQASLLRGSETGETMRSPSDVGEITEQNCDNFEENCRKLRDVGDAWLLIRPESEYKAPLLQLGGSKRRPDWTPCSLEHLVESQPFASLSADGDVHWGKSNVNPVPELVRATIGQEEFQGVLVLVFGEARSGHHEPEVIGLIVVRPAGRRVASETIDLIHAAASAIAAPLMIRKRLLEAASSADVIDMTGVQ